MTIMAIILRFLTIIICFGDPAVPVCRIARNKAGQDGMMKNTNTMPALSHCGYKFIFDYRRVDLSVQDARFRWKKIRRAFTAAAEYKITDFQKIRHSEVVHDGCGIPGRLLYTGMSR